MKLQSQKTYFLRYGESDPTPVELFVQEVGDDPGSLILEWFTDTKHYRVRVLLDSETEESNLYEAFDSQHAHFLGDLEVFKITRKSPFLKKLGIDGKKCDSDEEAEAYVELLTTTGFNFNRWKVHT